MMQRLEVAKNDARRAEVCLQLRGYCGHVVLPMRGDHASNRGVLVSSESGHVFQIQEAVPQLMPQKGAWDTPFDKRDEQAFPNFTTTRTT